MNSGSNENMSYRSLYISKNFNLFNRCVGLPIQYRNAVALDNIRYVQTKAAKEDVLNRYKEKLEKKMKEEGAESIEKLQEKYKDKIEKTKIELNRMDPLTDLEEYERKATKNGHKVTKLRSPRSPDAPIKPYKVLDDFLKLEKIKDLSPDQVEFLWRARFQEKENVLVAVIPKDVYQKLYTNARENPSFILPLPKEDEGVEIHFIQWAFPGPNTTHCMFTSLAEYKLHKEYAKPHTTLMFHHDISEDKNIVLMNGTVEQDANITLPETQLLVMNLQRFYGALAESPASNRRLQLLKDFTSGNENFSLDLVIQEAQSLEN
ncbi:F1 sector of mitochondrial F1F0 ATP synthase assembly [Komagataella phaffii CBS 7435]|uniref:Molecular chaperone n=2 Tax=Komagataella phaffii TaxID=460519 RepID=C4QVC4_KOMPG|nr:Molecular chaperone [Komagataella phaffii GS115]AOA60926.1 GQ67_02391T0 [Komagataella phaffii]CAH2445852.1 F1 sector of mitochondrial F1F0 ATP synthase assembly [Komagataella phaffii CBS 7435]AOA65389.1 GQ68_02856T0 [Komagataella phaffii GS115]CAY67197.1 Molecular chaperone [Komagataella phaffii GS115]CCA36306.1 F1 sector of mitochondrial F1F0 ATP synthase assembly [Komagataella phaffii CBS 7435]